MWYIFRKRFLLSCTCVVKHTVAAHFRCSHFKWKQVTIEIAHVCMCVCVWQKIRRAKQLQREVCIYEHLWALKYSYYRFLSAVGWVMPLQCFEIFIFFLSLSLYRLIFLKCDFNGKWMKTEWWWICFFFREYSFKLKQIIHVSWIFEWLFFLTSADGTGMLLMWSVQRTHTHTHIIHTHWRKLPSSQMRLTVLIFFPARAVVATFCHRAVSIIRNANFAICAQITWMSIPQIVKIRHYCINKLHFSQWKHAFSLAEVKSGRNKKRKSSFKFQLHWNILKYGKFIPNNAKMWKMRHEKTRTEDIYRKMVF